jgi:hypothetical protein
MRKMAILLCLLAGYTATSGQVCNSANTLRSGRFSLGIAPVMYVNYGNDVGLYLNGGIGIAKQMDFSLKLLLNDNSTYFGGDFEFVLVGGVPTISLAAGMHAHGNLGVDATFNLSFPIRNVASLYGGLDSDIEFYDNATGFPLWGFFGFQVMMRRSLGLFMEIDIGVNDHAPDMFVLGLNIFF